MVLSFRYIWIILSSLVKPRLVVSQRHHRYFRVLPFYDCEAGVSLNAARYAVLAELVQMDVLFRSGFVRNAVRAGYAPITLGTSIHYKKRVKVFTRLKVDTQLHAWDDKTLFWLTIFSSCSEGKIHAVSATRVTARFAGKVAGTERAFALQGVNPEHIPSRPVSPTLSRNFESLKELCDKICEEGTKVFYKD